MYTFKKPQSTDLADEILCQFDNRDFKIRSDIVRLPGLPLVQYDVICFNDVGYVEEISNCATVAMNEAGIRKTYS